MSRITEMRADKCFVKLSNVRLFLLFFLLIKGNCLFAQDTFRQYADSTSPAFRYDRPYYIVQWKANNKPSTPVIRMLDEHTAIVQITDPSQIQQLKVQATVAPAIDDWKYSSPAAAEMAVPRKKQIQQFILSGTSLQELLLALKKYPREARILSTNEPSAAVVVETDKDFFRSVILPLPQLIFADMRREPHTETGIIGLNRSYHGINALDYTFPGANGRNRVVGVKEQKMDASDLDLYKRVLNSSLAAPNTEYHATVISSIIGGAGNSNYDGRGIAWRCSFFPSTFSNLFGDDLSVLTSNNVTVQNHSYGTVIQQFYGAEAVSYDAQTWLNKNILHIFSAGNSGTRAASDGRYANLPGYANITGNFKTAKNIITVAAIDNKNNIPAESSAGPLYDGRLAPQITALGPNGTSDAAAMVSGTIAVMQQVFADSNSGQLPPASLVKAVLFNTTDDVYRSGIDYKTGYGVLNSYEAVRALQQKKYETGTVSQGQQWTKNITVPPGTAQIRITLAWTDSTAAINNNKALINDADLELADLTTGTIYKPWVLSVAAHLDSLAKLPVRKRDSLNTAEQVSVALPAAGNYQVRVNGTAISTTSLNFHIALQMDTLNTFRFTSPLHASDINRVENPNLDIRWRTFVADTNTTGNLFISYNSGANWQLLKAGHKVYTNLFQWPIKDTASTARLKMETPFGDYFSTDFIISPSLRPVVDFLCADSFRISWNKYVYASSYRLYTLIDSPYLKPFLTVNDSFAVLNRSTYPNLVYAVEPVLSNGLPAARSYAMDITQQGVKCFYRTFYYTLQNENKLDLILELSIASYTDSIYFERVTAGGGLLQTVGGLKVNGSGLLYQYTVEEIPQGTSYWRARIRLKNGSTVYTEIISVMSTGKKKLLFYPNPAGRNAAITYMLMQGVPASSRLQLYDITGRTVRSYTEMPGTIQPGSLPPGLYIYRLLSAEGQLLETGKLILQ